MTSPRWWTAGVLWGVLGGACGAPAPVANVGRTAPIATVDAGAGSAVVDTLPSLDALAARGPTDAPLMREAMRVAQASPRSPDVRADHDVCLRAVFAASGHARAWFADETGPRGEVASESSGTVPPRGPVCAKRGEALHLVIEGDPPVTARAVIFAAP